MKIKEYFADSRGVMPDQPGYRWWDSPHGRGEPKPADIEAAHMDLLKQQLEAKCGVRDAKAQLVT